jgi:hypothetical protein
MSYPLPVSFTEEDLVFLRFQALQYFKEMEPTSFLPGATRPVNLEEMRALSWLMASADLLHRKNCGTNIKAKLDIHDSESDTEY